MESHEPKLPPFVSARQAASQQARARAYQQVQELTRQGLHAEADSLWSEVIGSGLSQDAA